MEYCNYKFHKDSYPELMEFLSAVQENGEQPDIQLFSKLFPKNDGLKELEQQLKPTNKTESVVVLSDSDENEDSRTNSRYDMNLKDISIDVQSHTEMCADDLVDIIRESIAENQQIPGYVTEYLSDLENSVIFDSIYERLTTDNICQMGQHLCDFNYESSFTLNYFKFLLLPLICKEVSLDLQKSFSYFAARKISIIVKDMKISILSGTGKKLLENLVLLNSNEKNLLLREIISESTKLEENQMQAILPLINVDTHFECKKEIIYLMLQSAEEMSDNKTFGKLLIAIIQTIGKHLKQVESSIQLILTKHKSPFKIKAENELNKFNESFSLSQSLKY